MTDEELDKLLSTDSSTRIPLTPVTEDYYPKTFEEWVEIHGEPEYLYEETETKKQPSELDIDIEDHEEEAEYEENVDTDGIITQDDHGKPLLNHVKFVNAFAKLNKCVYCHGIFYTPDGMISNQSIRSDIAHSLGDFGWTSRLDVPTNALFTALKDMYSVDELPVNEKVIPLSNGDLDISKTPWVFKLGLKEQAPYRLSVRYTPLSHPMPLFDKWLHDVFVDEDIPVVQEIMGYCLVPVTSAQEAFFFVGDAGVGKSGFGTFLNAILGSAFEGVNTQELVSKRFQIATVENKLVAYDDDLGSAALEETGLLKKLITADSPIPAERKYGDPFDFIPYCKVVASANFMLSSLYDDSDGFYRRLHPILVKPKDPNRKTINKFYEMILATEKEQILRWALVGLKRVIKNGWKISWSDRSIEYMKGVKAQATHFEDFIRETCDFSDEGNVTSAELKKLYSRWCRDNGIKEATERRLFRWINDNIEKLGNPQSIKGVSASHAIKRNNRYVRGYSGMFIREEWKIGVI